MLRTTAHYRKQLRKPRWNNWSLLLFAPPKIQCTRSFMTTAKKKEDELHLLLILRTPWAFLSSDSTIAMLCREWLPLSLSLEWKWSCSKNPIQEQRCLCIYSRFLYCVCVDSLFNNFGFFEHEGQKGEGRKVEGEWESVVSTHFPFQSCKFPILPLHFKMVALFLQIQIPL